MHRGKEDRQCEKNAILKLNEFSSLKAAHEQFVWRVDDGWSE